MQSATTNPNEPDLKEFEKVFRKYYEPLCRYAYSIVRDADEAEEIVQEFFYTFWLNRNRISIRLSLKSYLYRSVRNRLFTLPTAQKHRGTVPQRG